MSNHNHFTRDIKKQGVCPSCDEYHANERKRSRDSLTPTEFLMMEVLAARYRLGNGWWTFPSFCKPAARRLEAKNLITWKPYVIEKTIMANLTDWGYNVWELYEPFPRER
jgi:hypothetical protein